MSRAMPKKKASGKSNFDFIRMLIKAKKGIKKFGMIENKVK